MKTKEFDFKIGTDPEFILTMQGRKVDAKQTMELMLKNKENFKPENSGFEVKPFGNIGWDGASSTAEMRPNAENTPQKITDNIGGLLKATTQHIKICDMSTLSEFSSIGGHIHLEIPKGEKWTKEKENTTHKRLASFYLPLLISENKTNLNLRLRQGYGTLSDHRIERKFTYEDGTPGFTFEFRCPAAEWLTTPKITQATLAYFAVIYHEILKHPKNFAKFNDIIYKTDKQSDALQALIIMEYDILTQSILNKVKKYVRTFEMYPNYKEEIEYLFNPKQVIKDKQKAEFNIAYGWNLLEKSTLPTKKEIFSSKKKIQEIANQTDFDILKRVMNITYNEDTNVALFAETFKDRVAAFNWKLKNNYFIFGLRKGINDIVAKNLKDEYLSGQNLIKTTLDATYMAKLFQKMAQKFEQLSGNNSSAERTTLDFTTGKPKDMRESIIIIGIPYEARIKENTTPFLEFIWSLEKGEIKGNTKKLNLRNDTNEPLENQGEIYKILTKQIELPQVIIDSGSNSLRNSERAVNSILNDPSVYINNPNQ